MMDDIISRQAALYSYQYEVCNKVRCFECKATDEDGTCKLERWIKELPSAERHGRWILNQNIAEPLFKCSSCGTAQGRVSRYCGECGAKMDEVENKNE